MADVVSSLTPEVRIPLKTGGTLVVRPLPTSMPFGRRGERPVRFILNSWARAKDLKWFGIPGVYIDGGQIECTFDAAVAVAQFLGEDPAIVPIPLQAEVPLPGECQYRALRLHEILRPYQKEAAIFLAQRSYGWNALPMGVGKTPATIAASLLIDAKKILVIPPAFVTREWAKQIAQFANDEALILQGRACREARILCKTCIGRGMIKDGNDMATLRPCPDCPRRTAGQRLFQIHDLRPVYDELATPDGASYSLYPPQTYSCPKHALILEANPGVCEACKDDLHDLIDRSRWVIVNAELLMAHKATDDWGGAYYRQDLAGWASVLSRFHFDLCIVDESQQFRGFQLGSIASKENKGETRRDRVKEVVHHIERIWMVSGTPMFGFTRDYWSQLDIMSRGLWSADWCPDLPWSFAKAYCDATRNEYNGYVWDGRSERAMTELEPRLQLLKFHKTRAEILPFLPRKTRQIVEIDASTAESKPIKLSKKAKKDKGERESALSKLLSRAADITRPVMIDKVMTEIAEGNKVIVFAKLHDSVDKIAKALDKTMSGREYGKSCERVNACLWACHGGQDANVRLKAGEAFQNHVGAGIFVATIDAFQVGVRLHSLAPDNPCTSVHFLEFHHSPQAMWQAEDRPYVPGIGGLTVYYYIARGTIHDRVLNQLIPRIETADILAHDDQAKEMFDVMVKKESETIDEILARLTVDSEDVIEVDDDQDYDD